MIVYTNPIRLNALWRNSMRFRLLLLVGLALTPVACDGNTASTSSLKPGQEQKQKETMKKTAPAD